MRDQTTIEGIYEALNPLPALLSAKGKVRAEVKFMLDANADFGIFVSWKREDAKYNYETDCEYFRSETFSGALDKATAFIAALPSAEQANLHSFMGKLGKLIDSGRDNGIALDYLNPLVDTMKRLSENVITYQPEPADA